MNNIWFISDTHFGHTNILKFKDKNGYPLRPFSTVWEMDGYIMDKWVSTIKSQDKVYHLGDVSFTQGGLQRMKDLPGRKRLVRGNHDKMKLKTYLEVFEEIYGVRQIDRFWMTHVPMHPGSVERARLNIHGHLHANKVMLTEMGVEKEDNRYLNVSVECLNDWTPIHFDEIIKIANERNR